MDSRYTQSINFRQVIVSFLDMRNNSRYTQNINFRQVIVSFLDMRNIIFLIFLQYYHNKF